MAELAAFHFLRPAWLLLLVPVGLLLWRISRSLNPERAWRGTIAAHLLPHLLVWHGARSPGPRPLQLMGVVWVLSVLALAGPAWQRQASPFTQDEAALVIALKVTPEMLARDVRPSRLERSVHKIRDLLNARSGAPTALVAYAGSAHLVMPLTTDGDIIAGFAAELTPDIMPLPGDAAAEAVALGNRLLRRSGASGSIVLIADRVESSQLAALQAARDGGGADVHILAVAAGVEVTPLPGGPPAPALDLGALRKAARAAGGSLVQVTPDDGDIRALARDVQRSLTRAPAQEGERWRDAGYWLLPVLALLLLPLFRRGGVAMLE